MSPRGWTRFAQQVAAGKEAKSARRDCEQLQGVRASHGGHVITSGPVVPTTLQPFARSRTTYVSHVVG